MPGLLSKLSSTTAEWSSPILQAIRDRTAPFLTEKQTNVSLMVAATVTGSWLLWKLFLAEPSNLPPGPRRFPLIGTMLNMGKSKDYYENFISLKEKYGDIYTIYFGPMRMVALNSHEMIRQAFLVQGSSTADRPYFPMKDLVTNNGEGLLLSDDTPRLRMQRKLAHQALRKFSTGGGIDRFLDKAFEALSAELDKDPNLNSEDMGYTVAYNILLSMCFGKTFSFDDPFFTDWIDRVKKLEKLFEENGMWEFVPFMEYIPRESKRLTIQTINIVHNYLLETIEEHKKTYDPDNLTDFTYQLLSVQEEVAMDPEEKGNLKLLNATSYLMILEDLFFAGTDTTRMTLAWIWHYLAAFPEVQRKAQEEVDTVVGRENPVTSKHRSQLPYCDAVLHEILRIKTVAPIGAMHKTSQDIKLGGYTIPKGTAMFSNTWSVHKDKRYWKDPEAFLPERWFDENGKYVYKEKGFVPFSMGRRSCIGESFVKVELLILMAKMLQRYTLEPQPGYRVSVKHEYMMTVKPVAQKPILAKRR